jgi:hypothetical protein
MKQFSIWRIFDSISAKFVQMFNWSTRSKSQETFKWIFVITQVSVQVSKTSLQNSTHGLRDERCNSRMKMYKHRVPVSQSLNQWFSTFLPPRPHFHSWLNSWPNAKEKHILVYIYKKKIHYLVRFSYNLLIKNWKCNNVEVKNPPNGKTTLVFLLRVSRSSD